MEITALIGWVSNKKNKINTSFFLNAINTKKFCKNAMVKKAVGMKSSQ
jgi:hypothetical protein